MSHRLHRLIIVVLVGLVLMVGSVNTIEIPSEVSIIKMLPADWNPYQRLYDELLSPTVRISSASGIGSGVIISATDFTDYILTAAHVVGNYSAVSVTFYSYCHQDTKTPSNSLCLSAFVVMTDTAKDLALLRLKPNTQETGRHALAWVAKLAPKDYTPYIFTPVWAVGCSLGLNPRPSFGHITAIVSHQDIHPPKAGKKTPSNSLCLSAFVASHWEISAPILPGNSGGPVFSANTHEVIGIAVWVHTYQGQLITTMAGVVPISEIYKFLDEFYRKDAENAKTGYNYILGELCASAVNLYQFVRYNEVSSERCTSEGVIPADRRSDEGPDVPRNEFGVNRDLRATKSLRNKVALRGELK